LSQLENLLEEKPVLVVDDDPSIVNVISQALASEGYPVVGAANGAEALRSLSELRPSVVLLDMVMPIMDGWDFIEVSKSSGLDLPIVIMSAYRSAADWARATGALDYLPKPFDLAELTAKVARFHAEG